jgi:hypothetical protein
MKHTGVSSDGKNHPFFNRFLRIPDSTLPEKPWPEVILSSLVLKKG